MMNGVRFICRKEVTVLETSLSPDRAEAENDKVRGAKNIPLEGETEAALDEDDDVLVVINLEAAEAAMFGKSTVMIRGWSGSFKERSEIDGEFSHGIALNVCVNLLADFLMFLSLFRGFSEIS